MNYQFTILGRFPGLNEYTKANRTSLIMGNKMKRQAQQFAEVNIINQIGRGTRIQKPVIIHYTFFEPNKKRDKDNISSFAHKVIQDALVACGVLENDGWKHVYGDTNTFACDPHNPRIEVLIEEVI